MMALIEYGLPIGLVVIGLGIVWAIINRSVAKSVDLNGRDGFGDCGAEGGIATNGGGNGGRGGDRFSAGKPGQNGFGFRK